MKSCINVGISCQCLTPRLPGCVTKKENPRHCCQGFSQGFVAPCFGTALRHRFIGSVAGSCILREI
jgi:hypothetical protein